MKKPFPLPLLLAATILVAAGCGDDSSGLLGPGPTSTLPAPTSPAETVSPVGSVVEPTVSPDSLPAPDPTETPDSTTSSSSTTTTEASPPPAPDAFVPVVTPAPSSDTQEDPPVQIDVVLPVVSGVPEAAGAAMNAAIGAEVLARPAAFRAEVESFAGEEPSDFGSFMVLDFEATAVTSAVLSLRFTEIAYFAGAANPSSGVFTLNFDPQTGDQLRLEDVVVDGAHLDLAARVERRLAEDLYGGDPAELQAWVPEIDPGMLTNWVITEAGLEFSFDEYVVGPGVFGAPTVVVSYGELDALVDPTGPAAGFAFG